MTPYLFVCKLGSRSKKEIYKKCARPVQPRTDHTKRRIDRHLQKSLNRSRASVYRYTNTDPRNLNPPFNPRKLNPEYRSDQKDPLLFHPNEVARFAKDALRIKDVTVEVLNSPSTATQQMLGAILEELKGIRAHLESLDGSPADLASRRDRQERPAA